MLAKLFHTISKIYSKVFGQDFESLPAYKAGEGSWNFVTFNINLWNIKKDIFGSLGYPVLP